MSAFIAVVCVLVWLAGTVWTTRRMMTAEYERDVSTYKYVDPDNSMLAPSVAAALFAWPFIALWYLTRSRLTRLLNPKLAAFEAAKRDAADFRAKAEQLRSDAAVIGGDAAVDLRSLAADYERMAREKDRVR